ncbi:hypothetical protein BHJ80_15965 [Escherichia coli]|nr:hypothetical protein BHJ80_15965 [Escherichia coli]
MLPNICSAVPAAYHPHPAVKFLETPAWYRFFQSLLRHFQFLPVARLFSTPVVASGSGIPAGCATVPGSAAAAYPPYLQWQYPDCAAHAVHVLCLPAGWSAEPFFSLVVVKRCLFLQLLLFHIQQRRALESALILTGQHTFYSLPLPVCAADALLQARSCLCAASAIL